MAGAVAVVLRGARSAVRRASCSGSAMEDAVPQPVGDGRRDGVSEGGVAWAVGCVSEVGQAVGESLEALAFGRCESADAGGQADGPGLLLLFVAWRHTSPEA